MTILPALQQYIDNLELQRAELTSVRKEKLGSLVDYINQRREKPGVISLNFICTHNSRRSHLGQIWATLSAHYYGIERVSAFSGGTEATAFNPRAVAAIERAGFGVSKSPGENPHYLVRHSLQAKESECFSKRFDDDFNPQVDFAAIMTCSDADRNCPLISGATRLSLPYLDPKAGDDTPEEAQLYDERCEQLACEMLYVFEQVAKKGAPSFRT